MAAILGAAPETVFPAVAERIRGVFGRFVEEVPPRRLVALAPPGPGEPAGLTIVTVEVEPAEGGGSSVRAVEEGFRDGAEWDARFATEERGWKGFFDELRTRFSK
jgi:hypothetical protein